MTGREPLIFVTDDAGTVQVREWFAETIMSVDFIADAPIVETEVVFRCANGTRRYRVTAYDPLTGHVMLKLLDIGAQEVA